MARGSHTRKARKTRRLSRRVRKSRRVQRGGKKVTIKKTGTAAAQAAPAKVHSKPNCGALPEGWSCAVDDRNNKGDVYYISPSGETQWERPSPQPDCGALPEGWSCNVDTRTGDVYYISPSGKTQWENPCGTLPKGWGCDETQDGEIYYTNPSSGDTQWENPCGTLPKGWGCDETQDGEIYYTNPSSGDTQWERPPVKSSISSPPTMPVSQPATPQVAAKVAVDEWEEYAKDQEVKLRTSLNQNKVPLDVVPQYIEYLHSLIKKFKEEYDNPGDIKLFTMKNARQHVIEKVFNDRKAKTQLQTVANHPSKNAKINQGVKHLLSSATAATNQAAAQRAAAEQGARRNNAKSLPLEKAWKEYEEKQLRILTAPLYQNYRIGELTDKNFNLEMKNAKEALSKEIQIMRNKYGRHLTPIAAEAAMRASVAQKPLFPEKPAAGRAANALKASQPPVQQPLVATNASSSGCPPLGTVKKGWTNITEPPKIKCRKTILQELLRTGIYTQSDKIIITNALSKKYRVSDIADFKIKERLENINETLKRKNQPPLGQEDIKYLIEETKNIKNQFEEELKEALDKLLADENFTKYFGSNSIYIYILQNLFKNKNNPGFYNYYGSASCNEGTGEKPSHKNLFRTYLIKKVKAHQSIQNLITSKNAHDLPALNHAIDEIIKDKVRPSYKKYNCQYASLGRENDIQISKIPLAKLFVEKLDKDTYKLGNVIHAIFKHSKREPSVNSILRHLDEIKYIDVEQYIDEKEIEGNI